MNSLKDAGIPRMERYTFQAPVPSGLTFNAQAWRQDVPGRGGFIDAPTEERIISAGFVRDMLIVLFEFSTWSSDIPLMKRFLLFGKGKGKLSIRSRNQPY